MDLDPALFAALQRFHEQQQTHRTSQIKLGTLTGQMPPSRRVIFLPSSTSTSVFRSRSRSTSISKIQRNSSKDRDLNNIKDILLVEDRDDEDASQLFHHIKHYSFFLT